MDRPEVTVVIPTHNRASFVVDAVRSVLEQRGAPPFDVIVVANACEDDTEEIIQDLARSDVRVRLVRERQPGVARARNAGLRLARGKYVFFTDDDVRVPKNWIATGMKYFIQEGCDALGGPILLELPSSACFPPWFCHALYPCLGLRPPEPRSRWLSCGDWMPYGANMAFRREALESIDGFPTDRGRVKGFLGLGEETAAFRTLCEKGGRVLMINEAPVLHRIRSEQMTKRYFRRWYMDAATERAFNDARRGVVHIRAWMVRRVCEEFFRCVWLGLQGRQKEAFSAELRAWEHIGILKGCWQARCG